MSSAAQSLDGRDRRVGLGQVDACVRYRVRRRAAPLPGIAERVRAPVRAAGVASRRRRHLRHSAHGRDRAAHQPRRPQEHGRHADRDLSFPAPALREARHAVLPGLRRADRAAEFRFHRRAHAQGLPRQEDRACSRRWSWRARVTTRIWPRGRPRRAIRTCASTARCMPTDNWPRLSRFHEHTIELPVATACSLAACEKPSCATALTTALDFGKGVVHVARSRTANRLPSSPRVARVRRARAASPSSIRACSPSTPSTAGAGMFRHRPEAARLR